MVRAALCTYKRCVYLLHSHRCHPNHKQVLKNKDRNKDDNKGEAENAVHLAWDISPDYRQKTKFVKGRFTKHIQTLDTPASPP
ncbi:MAG: hypothetical protein Kow0070_24520 [Anaerolineales bacterium]